MSQFFINQKTIKTSIEIQFRVLYLCGIITLLLLNCSCAEISKKNNREEVKSSEKTHLIIKKPGSSFSDTIIISTESAVFYEPDSMQMGKIKAVNEKKYF